MFGVFRVKNHDFTPKNHIFSNFRGTRAGCGPLDPSLLRHIGAVDGKDLISLRTA